MDKVTMCDISEIIDEYHSRNGITKLEASQRMGIDYSIYKQKTSLNYRHQLAVKELVPFIRAHDMDLTLLDRIENLLGRVAFEVPKGGEKLNPEHAVKMIKQCTRTIDMLSKAIADGVIDDKEQKEINTCMIEHNQVSAGFHAVVNNK